MICISGFAGAGKDECASQLVNGHHAVQTGLADPGKRHMADAYEFTEQQLFGPSPFRNAGDIRIQKNSFYERNLQELPMQIFPSDLVAGSESKYSIDGSKKYWTYGTDVLDSKRPHCKRDGGGWTVFVQECDPEFWLSPREALQIYLEQMNKLDVYTWIRKGVIDQLRIATGEFGYNRMHGLIPANTPLNEPVFSSTKWAKHSEHVITCFADFRHIPEIQWIREYESDAMHPFRPILIRVKRPSVSVPPYNHRSETEQTKIRDEAFDAVVQNDRDLPHLYGQIDHVVQLAKSGKLPVKSWRPDYVIPNRKPEEGYAP